MTAPRRVWLPYMALVISVMAGSTGPILVRLAQAEGVPTLIIVSFRMWIASLVLTPFVLSNFGPQLRALSHRDILLGLASGVIFAIQFIALFEAFSYTSILIAGVINGSIPLWAALMERYILKVRLNRLVWMGLGLALAGGVVIGLSGQGGNAGDRVLLGAILALTSAIMAAIYLIIGRTTRTHIDLLPYIWMVFSWGAVTMLIMVVATGEQVIGYSPEAYVWMVLLTIFAQLIAHSGFNYTLAYLPATFISISAQVVSVIAAIAAFFIFSEVPGALQIVGSLVITLGVVMATIGQTRKSQPPASENPR